MDDAHELLLEAHRERIAELETELQQEREAHGRIEERWQAQVLELNGRIAELEALLRKASGSTSAELAADIRAALAGRSK